MFGKKLEDAELQASVADLKYTVRLKEEEIQRLNDLIKKERRDREAKVQDLEVAQRNIARNNDEVISNLQLDIENRDDHIELLEGLVSDQSDLDERDIKLSHAEKMLAAREVNADNFVKKIAETQEKAEKDGEQRYRAGYTDGLADGLRKAHEITAEDRKASMQIAALSAASHQPDATRQIAAAIAKDVARALPSGTSNKKK